MACDSPDSVAAFALVCIICIFVTVVVILLVSLSPELTTMPPKYEGFASPGWYGVAKVFKKHVEEGYHRGGGFAVYHKGKLVLEYVGGYADEEADWPWDKTTVSCIYGCTKGIGAIVIAILVDRGLLAYSSPVASYWPEFAVNGKESITVEQLLSHQAGLIVLDEDYSLSDITTNPGKMSRLLASARPQWEPGTAHGFHLITIGLYMDQLVRKVDPKHRSIDQFFSEEVSRKFGIDCFIGLPREENYRCARLEDFSLKILYDWLCTTKYSQCSNLVDSDSHLKKMLKNNGEYDKIFYNNPTYRKIPCISTHGFATATGLAKLYGILANGGRHKGQTLLSSSAVEKLNEPLVSGVGCVFCIDTTIGRGTIIMKSEDDHNIFGHPGFGGQAGFADPKHKIGWAYITNHPSFFCYADDWKYRQLIEQVYETVIELEGREVS